MSSEQLPERGDPIRMTLSPGYLDVVRDMAQERYDIAVQQGNEPAPSDMWILYRDPDLLAIKFRDVRDVSELVIRLSDYIRDNDRTVTNIQMSQPSGAAVKLVGIREARTQRAAELLAAVQPKLTAQEIIGLRQSESFPEEWAS